jgi:hypothetical protein
VAQTSASMSNGFGRAERETVREQLASLGSPYVPQEPNRRAEPRRLGCQFVFIRRRLAPEAGTHQLVVLWNVSQAGVGLVMSHALQPGTELCLQFRRAAIEDRVATVVHATRCEAGWLVGCALDRPFSPIELQALVIE